MIAENQLAEYLAEIRSHVCSRCIEKPAGGPPCAPLGKDCGVELHLPQLVESIHSTHSPMVAAYLDHNRREICEKCAFLHSSICPCPMDYLAALLVEAVEAVDERMEGRERQRAFLARRAEAKASERGVVRRLYDEAHDGWTGCDWHTQFGDTALDLYGVSPEDAEKMAAETAGSGVETDWRAAARWLSQVRHYAEQAEFEAGIAMKAAEADDWPKARRHAERAWILEYATGRSIRAPFPPTWQRFYQAIQEITDARKVGQAGYLEEVQAQD